LLSRAALDGIRFNSKRLIMLNFFKKYQIALAFSLLLFASISVYLNILSNPFIWSEDAVVVENPTFKDLSYLPKFFTKYYWLKEHPFSGTQLFRPLRAVTFTLEYALWGLNPVPYHLFNILLHALTTLLVFFLFKKISRSFKLGFLTALFFAVHPVHTETITWIMSRDDIMCTLFPLVSWWFFIRRIENPSKKWPYLIIETFFFILGLLSREMAAVFPLLLCLYVVFFYPKRKWKEYLLATLPYWLIDFAYAFFHFYFWWPSLRQDRLASDLIPPFSNHLLLVAKTIGFYLKLLVLPIKLCADHYFPVYVTLAETDTKIWVFLFLLAVWLAFRCIKSQRRCPEPFGFVQGREISFAILFTTLAFLPVANIIIVTGRPVAEQRLYLPSIGFCFLIALLFQTITIPDRFRFVIRDQVLRTLLIILLVGFYSYLTVQRNYEWRSPLALWESAVWVSPRTERARRNLASAYLDIGEEEKAMMEFETIVNLEETERAKRAGLGLKVKRGEPIGALTAPIMPVEDAEKICEMKEELEEEARIRMVSEDARVHILLGDSYRKKKGDLKRAAYEYNMAIVYDPSSFEAYNGLGITYDMAGFFEAAIFVLDKGTKISSGFYPLHYNLGLAYEHAEKYKEAIKAYQKVIELEPYYDQPYLRLTIIYAKHEVNLDRAREYWEEYLNVSFHPDPEYVEEFKDLFK
jgi:tetratricopeptide (TPR) repeat protein